MAKLKIDRSRFQPKVLAPGKQTNAAKEKVVLKNVVGVDAPDVFIDEMLTCSTIELLKQNQPLKFRAELDVGEYGVIIGPAVMHVAQNNKTYLAAGEVGSSHDGCRRYISFELETATSREVVTDCDNGRTVHGFLTHLGHFLCRFKAAQVYTWMKERYKYQPNSLKEELNTSILYSYHLNTHFVTQCLERMKKQSKACKIE